MLVPRTTRLQILCPNHLSILFPQYLMENLWHDQKSLFSTYSPPPPKKNSLAVNDFKIVTESQ